MSDENVNNEAVEVSSDQNYNQAAHEYVESEGLLSESEGNSKEVQEVIEEASEPDAEQEAASEEEFSEEVEGQEELSADSEQTEEGDEPEEGPSEEPESYVFEVNGQEVEMTTDELIDAARSGLELEAGVEQTLKDVEEYVGQHEEQLVRLETLDQVFNQLRTTEPALIEELEEAAAKILPQLQNPVVKNLESKLASLEKEVSQKKYGRRGHSNP